MKPICWFVATALAVATTGCSMVYEDADDSCVASEEQVYLQFRIVNNTISAREAESRVDYTYEEASGAENYIGIEDKDFRLYVLDADRTADQMQNARLISAYEPTLYPVGSNYAAYDIKIGIDKSKLNLSGNTVKLQFVCFANWLGTGNPSTTVYPTVTEGTTTRAQLLDLNGTHFYLPTTGSDGTISWAPNLEANANGGRRIPMYGFRTYEFNKELLEKSTFYNPFNINLNVGPGEDDGCLYMMRTLARLDVIDNATRYENSEYPKITSVSLSNWNYQGYCINNKLEGADTHSYVNNVNIPSPVGYTTEPMNFLLSHSQLPDEYSERGCFRAYFPELVLSIANPELNVTVQVNEEKTENYSVVLSAQGFADWNNQLRRNYIYRVMLNYSIDSKLDLQYTICPWETYTVDIPPFE